ncbi:lipocalin-like domain-containing protein [Nodularia sphaerocarpa]|uniref:lipocalin-like domain-containing protein n=1 Tax=Nodularia sphaerocarpa TaxID=137816 RepID=UPI001EFA4CCA|nr:lipocalin-like domain-containing protein [Nodularia sphaerocarpa]MDB9372173.1 lipocalin-like domain-containing protein [Nodularia sphaerocarpa CS-585]MDB9376983.1 lipocalin-like domain-containing protein [Nodularia sphaerocarpa CS-585A2]
MNKKNFVGTWKLVSWETKSADGKIIHPFGENPIGYITYTESGYMSATIMKPHRLNIEVSSADLMNARRIFLKPWLLITAGKYIKAIIRYLQASANYVSYSGKYEIQAETVIHDVEVSLIPDWIGTKQEREFKFIGDKLVLVTPPIGGNPQSLTWERV